MNLKALINSRYSINVIDVDLEKNLADYRLNNSSISEEEYEKRIQELDSLLPFVESSPPNIGENDSLIPYYELDGNSIIQKWEIVESDISVINQKIIALKTKLSNTDYRVVKCYETSLLNMPLPYSIEEIHQARQIIRDEINRLEELIVSNT